MPRPVCVPCKTEMRPDKNGVPYVQTSDGNPYQVWDSDRWRCPACGATILSGFGQKPYLVNYEERFETFIQKIKEDPNVVIERGSG